MYRVSGRQLAGLALTSALVAGIVVACAQRAIENGERDPLVRPVVADLAPSSDEQNNVDIYRAVSPGVVNINNRGYQRGLYGILPTEGSGSGSVIDDGGHILTNHHVVRGAVELEVQIEDDKYAARVVGADPESDLAIIKIEAPAERLTVIKLGTSEHLQVGQKVLAIGNPFGLQRTLTTGIISGLGRPIRDPESGRTLEGAIQTDASINPGNSGGPLLNARGEMIGINTAIFSVSGGSIGIGFAVPVDLARRIIPDLIEKGYVAYPWMGISTLPLNRDIARQLRLKVDSGLLVGDVYRSSGAAAAGLRGSRLRGTLGRGVIVESVGDVIVAVGGQPVGSTGDLQKVLRQHQPDDVIQVEVDRDGRRVKLDVRLSERPMDHR